MSTPLYLFSQSPLQDATFFACLERLPVQGALVLLGDAVYATCSVNFLSVSLAKKIICYGLLPDAVARGIATPSSQVQWIDYDELVAIVAAHTPIISW